MLNGFFYSLSFSIEVSKLRIRKSHPTKCMVCSSKTLAIRHLQQFGACSRVSNFDPLIQGLL